MAEKSKFNGTGRRKSSVARVTLTSPGKGNIEINGVALDNYVPRESLATMVKQPLAALDKNKEYSPFIIIEELISKLINVMDISENDMKIKNMTFLLMLKVGVFQGKPAQSDLVFPELSFLLHLKIGQF